MKHNPRPDTDLRHADDAEILAALIGPVCPENLRRASQLLELVGGYPELTKASLKELIVADGIGMATAYRIQAAIEAGRRAITRPLDRGSPLTSARDVYEALAPRLSDLLHEEFLALALDRRQRILRIIEVSRGTLDASIVHPREVFREAIREAAAAVVIVHNHPSGETTPSDQDRHLTRRLAVAAEMLGIDLLDHVIVCRGGYHSFRDAGEL